MSPRPCGQIHHPPSFPRVSGDEPNFGQRLRVVQTFSPRERG